MIKKFLFFALVLIYSTTLHAQSPYGKVLTLDNSGAQQWIDIGTVLSNYITYHVGSNSPAWLTNGNAITTGVFLGTTNNQPLIFKTNGIEHMRLLENGGIRLYNSSGANTITFQYSGTNDLTFTLPASYGTTGQFLTTDGSGNLSWASASGSSGWGLTGNSGTDPSTNFIGTTDAAALQIKVNNQKSGWIDYTNPYNSAWGYQALNSNTTGSWNTASGYQALYSNTSGEMNTASGAWALTANTSGNNNTAVGYMAGYNITTGNNNIFIGYNAQPSSATVSNEVTIGNSNNNSYRMYAASWTNASDARYKHDIEQLPFGLDFILQLKPRQYVYNNSTDGKITMGFIAQEVQEVMRQVGMVDKYNLVKPLEKDFLGLNTTEIIPILVKAVQEQQQTIEQMRAQNEQMLAENEQMKAQNEQMRAENEALKQRLERLEKYVFERTGSGDNNVGMK